MLQEIKSIKDVRAFATYLLVVEKISFHPDDDFNDYIHLQTKKPIYTPEEAALRNKLMDDCFNVCNQNQTEIYEAILPTILKNINNIDIN